MGGLVEVAGGVPPGRGVAAGDVAALEALAQVTQWCPSWRQRRRAGGPARRAGMLEVVAVARDRSVSPASARSSVAMSSIDSSTSSMASTSATTSERPCPRRGLEHPRTLGLASARAAARRGRSATRSETAEPFPGGVALVEPLPDQVDDALRRRSRAPRAGQPGLRGLLEQGGASQRVLRRIGRRTRSRRASQGSDIPWRNRVPATTANAISSSTSRCGCPPG